MENLIVVLMLVAMYALAAIAYRRPGGYQKIVWPLMAVTVAASLGVNVWNISSDRTEQALGPYIADDKFAEATKAADAVVVPPDAALLIVVIIPVYLMVLLLLPFLLERVRAKRDGGDEEA